MNRTYRLVWNEATQRYVPAAERARARGKSGGCKALKRLGVLVLTATLVSRYVATAEAAPTGGTVSSGKGTISQTGSTTTVTQASQDLSLNWTGFSIAAGETVRFVQPSSTAVALNRVTGTDPSQIYGQLQANGQVFLINPNGVLFAPGAAVNVGSLVASTLKLTDADFQSGHYQFTAGSTTGVVDNQGHLTAAPGGYLALLGPTTRNNGTMTATSGTVLLAAGKKVSLQLKNGSLLSYSIDQGALQALAENNQLIQADGGHVYLSAQGADAVSKAVVNNTGIIEARTVDNHNGVIRLVGDATVGQVNLTGTLDASAPHGGNGGTIETSAAQVEVADTVHVTTVAPAGKTGTWSIDQANFTVAASGGDISGATLSTELATTGVTLTATRGNTSGSGDILVDDAVSWSANTALTLNAGHNIQINSNLTATGNTAGLVLNYGKGDNYFINGGKVTLSGAHPALSIGGHAYTVINSLGVQNDTTRATLQGIRNDLSGYYALGSDIDASATSGWTAIRGLIGFNPLGTANYAFSGQFTGLGHVISNLTINSSKSSGVGLFGVTSPGSVIRDVGLNGGSIKGTGYVGSLVGFNEGEILDSYSTVTVSGQHHLGGLVGENDGTISTSYATGAVTGLDEITGGLVGLNDGTITDSYATGSVSGHDGIVGGLVGENGGAIADSYSAGKVGGATWRVGGLVGYDTGNGCSGGTVTNSFWDKTTSGQATSDGGVGMTTAQMQNQADFTSATAANGRVNPNWDFNNVWLMYNGSTYPLLKSFLKPIVVTANNVSAVYTSAAWNGSDTYTCSTGSCAGLLGTIKFGGTAAGAINVGDYSILPGGLYSTQQGYAITYVAGQLAITPAPLTITGLSASNKVYDATTAALLSGTAKISPLGSDSVTLSGTGVGVFDSKNVGTGKAVIVGGYTLSGAAASNYTLVEPVGLTASITPASLVISGITANNKVYDTTVADTLSGTMTVTALGHDSVSLGGIGTAVFADKNVGTGKAVTVSGYTLSGADAGNYTLVEPTGLTANITPASLVIIGITANNKVYDTTVADTLSGTARVTALGADSVVITGTGSGVFSDKNAGIDKAVTVSGYTLSGADAGNYVLAGPTGLTADISPANLVISGLTASNRIYDATAAATLSGTATVSALGSDRVTLSGTGSGVFSNKNVGIDKLVTVSGYTLSGADAGNYTLVEPTGVTASITPASLMVTGVTANSRVYDGTLTATLSGTATVAALGSDSVALNGSGSSSFADKNVGNNKAVAVSGYFLAGADAANYTLVEPTGLTANITPASLQVSGITVNNKVYDTTATAALSGTAVVTPLGNDSVAVSVTGVGAFSDKNAGLDKSVTISGYTLTGADAGNYTLVEPTGLTANIAPANLMVSGLTATNRVYDGSVTAMLSGTVFVSALGNDAVNLAGTGSGTFTNKNVGTSKTVSISGFSLSGADAANYTLVEPTNVTANITARPLTVSATGFDKIYDGTTSAAVTLTDNRIAGDSLVAGYTSSGFADANVGTGRAVNVSGISLTGTDAGNYTYNTSAATTANITAAPLAITANAAGKTYDGLAYNGGNGVTFNGFVDGQTPSVLEGALTYGGSSQGAVNVGSYSIVPGGFTSSNYTITFVDGALTIAPAATGPVNAPMAAAAFSGAVEGQAALSSSATSPYHDASRGVVDTASYTLISSELPSDTYGIGYIDGTLTIGPRRR